MASHAHQAKQYHDDSAQDETTCHHTIFPQSSTSETFKPYPVQPKFDKSSTLVSQTLQPHSQVPKPKEIDYSTWDIVKITQYGILDQLKERVANGYDVRQPDEQNVTLLHWAAINNRLEIVRYLISKGAVLDERGGDLNSTALQWATRQGHLQMVVLLIQYGADPALYDGEGCACIHLASQFGHTGILAFLIAKGQDVDSLDANGMTPLMWTAYRAFILDQIRLLITMGASCNLQDRLQKNTPLHWAILSDNNTAIGHLIKIGADTYIENSKGETAMKLAVVKRNGFAFKKIQEIRGEATSQRSYFMKLTMNPDVREKIMQIFPFFLIFYVGFIPQLSLQFIWKFLLLVLLSLLSWFVSRNFFDHRSGVLMPLYVYLATKLLMYTAWFIFYWPYVSDPVTFTLFTINSLLLMYYFWKSWKTDPGFLKTSQEQKKKVILELCEINSLNMQYFCTTCLIKKPIRSKHCSICDQCVARMDHHCPWIDNCVGVNNHHYFILYLATLLGMIGWCIYGTILYWQNSCQTSFEEDGIWQYISQIAHCSPFVFWTGLNCLFHVVWVGLLLACQLYQIIWLGVTTNERMNAFRYDHFKDSTGKFKSPFYHGIIKNVVNFFQFRCFGLCHPTIIDWYNQFSSDLEKKMDAHEFV